MTFDELNLAPAILKAVHETGYETPTPIQAQAIPAVLEGHDLLAGAQTGTGKTAAFTLPSIQRMAAAGKRVLPTHCRMLVLAPTRELASQIADNARRATAPKHAGAPRGKRQWRSARDARRGDLATCGTQ